MSASMSATPTNGTGCALCESQWRIAQLFQAGTDDHVYSLTVDKIKSLLGKDYKQGERVDRFEMRNLCAVHFLLKNHLDRGVASTSTYDYLGKNVAEYLRAKHVDIPNKFLERGRI